MWNGESRELGFDQPAAAIVEDAYLRIVILPTKIRAGSREGPARKLNINVQSLPYQVTGVGVLAPEYQ